LKDSAIYIHIPFCDHKCIYCDFYSIITYGNIGNYLSSITKEIIKYSQEYSDDRNYSSIFFGGGTPSLMEPEYLGDIIECIKEHYKVDDCAEITIETNPGTVNKDKLKRFKEFGFNRISIGVQSFNNDELKFLTRIHDKDLAVSTIINAAEAGFENISIDLIFNLPGQTKEKWLLNLETTLNMPVKHISAYSLILERGTILHKMVLDGKVKIQNSDYDADLYYLTMNFLQKNGFIQYEVSNFARTGYECKHNKAYWHYYDYLSFGTSAHSFINGRRWWNFSSLKKYLSEVNDKGTAVANYEDLTREQMLYEYIMLGLRSDGIIIKDLTEKFGSAWIEERMGKLKFFEKEGLLFIDNFIRLTQKGYALCDKILEVIL
jgi:oxygen-independent coproporphyrinogen-3 oxidase